jgi:hypothetical protein
MVKTLSIQLLILLTALSLSACASSSSSDKSAANTQQRRASCVDPDQIRNWQLTPSNQLVLDAGTRYFKADLGVCPSLDMAITLGFRTRNTAGWICGGPGDQIVTRDGHCMIFDLTEISKEDYLQQTAKPKKTKQSP